MQADFIKLYMKQTHLTIYISYLFNLMCIYAVEN